MKNLLTIGLLISVALSLTNCVVVRQIDRQRLAKTHMQFEPLPQEQSFIDEVHSVREGAEGGKGKTGGGGCGCK